MAARQPLRSQPRCYLLKGQVWPDGRLGRGAPAEAVLAQHVARALKEACATAGHNPRDAAAKTGLGYGTIHGLLSGRSWATLRTIGALAQSYNIHLSATRRASLAPYPRAYLVKGARWPDGSLKASAPPEALLAREVSQRLRDRCRSRFEDHHCDRGFDLDRVVAVTRASRAAIEDLLDGRVWVDLPTIARLEGRLDIPLWVNQQRHRSAYR